MNQQFTSLQILWGLLLYFQQQHAIVWNFGDSGTQKRHDLITLSKSELTSEFRTRKKDIFSWIEEHIRYFLLPTKDGSITCYELEGSVDDKLSIRALLPAIANTRPHYQQAIARIQQQFIPRVSIIQQTHSYIRLLREKSKFVCKFVQSQDVSSISRKRGIRKGRKLINMNITDLRSILYSCMEQFLSPESIEQFQEQNQSILQGFTKAELAIIIEGMFRLYQHVNGTPEFVVAVPIQTSFLLSSSS